MFTNVLGTDYIEVLFTLIDGNLNEDTLGPVRVVASQHAGEYFGFATKARNRGVTNSFRNAPWTMDYRSFGFTDSSAPLLEGYDLWASRWGTDIGGRTNDYELDGLVNWIEYALGGNPLSNDASDILPAGSIGADGGSDWLYYTYKRRDDAAARGLTYRVMSGTNLVDGLSNAVPAWSLSPATNGFQTVTHRISRSPGTARPA